MYNQEKMMLEYLIRHKTITGLEALTKLGIMSYTKSICRLRDAGVVIHGEWKTHKSRFGLKRYMEYRLVKVPAKVKKTFL